MCPCVFALIVASREQNAVVLSASQIWRCEKMRHLIVFSDLALANEICLAGVRRRELLLEESVKVSVLVLIRCQRWSTVLFDEFRCDQSLDERLSIGTSLETGVAGVEERKVVAEFVCLHDSGPVVLLFFRSFGRRRRRLHAPPAAAAAVFAGKIVSGQLDEENPFVLISSALLVQPDEGVSDLFVDRIGVNYRNLPRRAGLFTNTPPPSSQKPPPPSPPRAVAAAAVFAGKIVSGQLDEENSFVLISSALLVQPDEGVSDLVVDRIGVNYRNLPRRAGLL
ncbi:hypothetical protein F511_15665 [Dorcoceras hygrometricum]|uniref:Uncharacterized protein n=1 Tax=Dorcoceras hygrometricum TaxID=472368 RepID=A0A2Z7AA38_9LAMI|nr:hypothetical protein F511_15665 [Dorcoceras hygrometricum]